MGHLSHLYRTDAAPASRDARHRGAGREVWGQGTNRVIAACKRHGAAPPKFEEFQGFLVVTFKAQMMAKTLGGLLGDASDG